MQIKRLAANLFFCFFMTFIITACSLSDAVPAFAANPPSQLYAKYSALIDASNGRVLFEKDGYTKAANASTTKILTCLLAVELGNFDDVVTVSAYAASMPDVQLNITKGEQYYLKDLLYSLMLQSHNDSAVAIAEHIAEKYIVKDFTPHDAASRPRDESLLLVKAFAAEMNSRASKIGCNDTYFITPNGLDAENEDGFHSTTAVDLARIMAECIKNEDFIRITQTSAHSFSNLKGSASRSVHNANAFLNMMDGVISGKTGFTGKAGYCYVCAFERDGRKFVSVVLACGWPNNKTYKWKDTRKILEYAGSSYFNSEIFTPVESYMDIPVTNGKTDFISTYIPDSVELLTGENDIINITYEIPEYIDAPVSSDFVVGKVNIYINDELYTQLPIYSGNSAERTDYTYYLKQLIELFLF